MTASTRMVGSRLSLQQVAVHTLARRRHAVTGRFGLRPSPGGLATPAFGDQGEVVRISGSMLVVERDGHARAELLTTLGRAAEHVGVDLAAEFSVGQATPGLADPDAPLAIDPAAARALADWWYFGATLLDEVAATTAAVVATTVAQLWPEHFDHACAVTVTAAGGAGPVGAPTGVLNLGASPGDGYEPLPYLYVGPHGAERPGDAGYWNAPFGAVLRRAELAGLDGDERRSRALAFLQRGIELASGGDG
jgi:hypothetical protein